MKKIITSLIFVALILAAFLGINHKQKKDAIINEYVFEYYLSNNENKVFNVMYDGFPIPKYNYARPFRGELSNIALESEVIDEILPYYPLIVSVDRKETTALLTSGSHQKSIVLPYSENGDPYGNTYDCIHILPYTEKKVFEEILDVKKLKSDSGIYISERFIDDCHFDIKNGDLSITAIVSIPKTAAVYERESYWIEEETRVEHRDMYESYEIEDYIEVEYTFPIAGIISKSNTAFSDLYSAQLWIPYELSEKIYEASQTEPMGTLKEDVERWEPSTYIVKLNKKMVSDEVGEELLKYLPDFILKEVGLIGEDSRVHIYSQDKD